MAMTEAAGAAVWASRFESWAAACAKKHGGKYDYSLARTRVIDKVWKVKIICPDHGPFLQAPAKHKMGRGCPTCARREGVDYVADLVKMFPKWDFSGVEIKGSQEKVKLTCRKHGAFETTFNKLYNAKGKWGISTPCPKCNKEGAGLRRRIGMEEIVKRLTETFPTYEFHLPNYGLTVSEKIAYTCPEHGKNSSLIYDMFNGHGCPGCGAESRRKGIIEVRGVSPIQNVLDIYETHGGTLIPHYRTIKSTHEKVRMTCLDHGSYETMLYAVKAGAKCPKCSNRVSKAEQELTQFFRDLGETVETQVFGMYERRGWLDIYLPEHNLAVEYCGLYWHGDNIRKDKYAHYKDFKEAEQAGMRLVTLFEDEWKHRKQAVKATLITMLKQYGTTGARKLKLEKVSWSVVAPMYDVWHLQGAGTPCSENYVLMRGNDVVSAMSFKADRFGDQDYELVRYATTERVSGGFNRLLAAFAKENRGKTLVSYSDNRWFTGGAYVRAGFQLVGDTTPGYWWCKRSERFSRFRFQKHKLPSVISNFDDSLSESENMRNNGYWKIWDCGMRKWVKTL